MSTHQPGPWAAEPAAESVVGDHGGARVPRRGRAYATRDFGFERVPDAVTRLWLDHLSPDGPAAVARKLRRGYVENPAGVGAGVLLSADGEDAPIGTLALHPRRLWLAGQPVRAAGLSDFAVDPRHRTLGPAVQLMRRAVALGLSRVDLLYGLGNRKSAAVCARVGLGRLGSMQRHVKLLASRDHLARVLPGPIAQVIATGVDASLAARDFMRRGAGGDTLACEPAGFDAPALDVIWAAAPVDLLLSERSGAMLRWRYGDASGTAGRGACRLSLARGADGEPIGYVVWRPREHVADVHDFLCRDPLHGTGPLMAAFARQMRDEGLHSVSVSFFGHAAVADGLAQAGFLPRDDDDALTVVVRAGERAPAGVAEPARWYLTCFDNDGD